MPGINTSSAKSSVITKQSSQNLLAQKIYTKQQKTFILQDPNADPQDLDNLASDESWYIRQTVGRHNRSLLITLDNLSRDVDFRVRCGAAVNPTICGSKEILNRLLRDHSIEVLRAFTGNPSLPLFCLKTLSVNSDWQVRWGVARHPNSAEDTEYPTILEKLSKDAEQLVRWGVAENPACTSEILDNLAVPTNDLFVRWAVAENNNTSNETLQKLLNDTDKMVRKSAEANLRRRGITPKTVLRDIKTKVFNAVSSASLASSLSNLFKKKVYEKTRKLPGAKGIAVTQGYYKNSKFNLVAIDPKLNEMIVYLAPQRKDGSFETRTLDFVAEKYPGIHAVLNGAFFNNSPGGDNQPLGPVIYQWGKYFWTPTTKNYEGLPVYSFNRPFFAIDKSGVPVIRQSEGKRAEELLKDGYMMLLGGGGPFIQDGKIIVSEKTLNDAHISPQTHQINTPRQRTCVGIKEDGTILFCTFGYQDGNNALSGGITLLALAEFMLSKGAKDALFFDGGGSTGLYLSDEGCNSTGVPREQPTYLIVTDKTSAKFIEKLENENEKLFRRKK